ncbi:malonate-semialdehyde dehydrogenase (acetylating) [Desmophyllum pertusum]|uniref:Malonate-semialdehyde dehydrogenase (Acetylating) n=1 Tax=Desmophyllum pertusum TaxID=174260 RepID=A0A9W9Z144_9CNID|nr:malonate-semialdehyde dehydrogenase (acetylating) [Desmophyllum pertusum]
MLRSACSFSRLLNGGKKTAPLAAAWRRFYGDGSNTKLFINGQFVESTTDKWIDIHNPATNEVISRAPESTNAEMESAVAAASAAFPDWAEQSVLSRQQVMFNLQHLVKNHMKEIADLITLDTGRQRQMLWAVYKEDYRLLSMPVQSHPCRWVKQCHRSPRTWIRIPTELHWVSAQESHRCIDLCHLKPNHLALPRTTVPSLPCPFVIPVLISLPSKAPSKAPTSTMPAPKVESYLVA